MAQSKDYRVGDVFPADARSAAFVRVLVASRQLLTFLQLYQKLDPRRSPGERERFYFIVSGSFGAAKEASDAFRDADANGVFQWVAVAKNQTELQEAFRRVRASCSKDDASSLYSRVIKDIRDSAAWHWNRDRVQQALKDLADRRLSIFEGSGQVHDTGILLVAHVTAAIALLQTIQLEKLRDTMLEVVSFHGDLIDVVHRTYYRVVGAEGSGAA